MITLIKVKHVLQEFNERFSTTFPASRYVTTCFLAKRATNITGGGGCPWKQLDTKQRPSFKLKTKHSHSPPNTHAHTHTHPTHTHTPHTHTHTPHTPPPPPHTHTHKHTPTVCPPRFSTTGDARCLIIVLPHISFSSKRNVYTARWCTFGELCNSPKIHLF